jgi:hypothetical protein
MRIIDGLVLSGHPAEIPDCSRDDLPSFFKEMGYATGAEIGVDKGDFSEKFCRAGLTHYAIDPWQSYPDYEETQGQKRLDILYDYTKRKLSPYPNGKIIRKTSMEAAEDFADESLDYVYIDGNHQFRYVADDLAEWSKKVRKGGVISGHDYIYTNPRTQAGICHVIYVVNAFTSAYKIRNWYLLGRYERRPDEVRDRFRSFLWIKE